METSPKKTPMPRTEPWRWHSRRVAPAGILFTRYSFSQSYVVTRRSHEYVAFQAHKPTTKGAQGQGTGGSFGRHPSQASVQLKEATDPRDCTDANTKWPNRRWSL